MPDPDVFSGDLNQMLAGVTNNGLYMFSVDTKDLSIPVTSVPMSRDAPRNETNRRYFEFK